MDNKIEIRALSRGIVSKLFNDQVKERYSNNETLLDACLIREWDTHPEIQVKQNLFYLTLGNFTPVYEEKVYMRNKVKTVETPWMLLHLNFREKYIKDRNTDEMKPLGQRRIKINNIDINNVTPETIKKAFDNVSFVYGDSWVSYGFTNGKEIQLKHVGSKGMGIELIEKCLPFTVQSSQREGNDLSKNVSLLTFAENTPKVDTYGLRGYVFKVTFHEKQGKRTNQLSRVFVANKIKDRK